MAQVTTANHQHTECCAEACARGAVMGLMNSKQGVVYSVCSHTGSQLEVWDQLGLHPLTSNPTPSAASAFALCSSQSLVATAHKDFKIRLWRTSHSAPSSPAIHTTLPSLRQYFHNWALQHRYIQTRRHGKKWAWMQHSDTISALAFSADHTHLYSASWDRTIKVWNLARMRCEESFTAHHDSINAMAVGAQDGLLYTGSADKSIRVWSRRRVHGNNKLGKHAMVVSMERGQGAAVNALVLTRDCMRLYSGGSDGQIVVWRRSSPSWPHKLAAPSTQLMQVQQKLQGHRQAVLCLDMHPDEALLISGSADKTIRLWSCPPSGKSSKALYQEMSCLAVLKGHSAPVRSLTWSAWAGIAAGHDKNDGGPSAAGAGVVYSGSLDGCIKMWMVTVVPAEHEEDK